MHVIIDVAVQYSRVERFKQTNLTMNLDQIWAGLKLG
jgi:hypothetical protein